MKKEFWLALEDHEGHSDVTWDSEGNPYLKVSFVSDDGNHIIELRPFEEYEK